jgi:uncharacterized HAD superfamily protein
MKVPLIAFDFDDVLMNFNAGFVTFHNRVYSTNLEYEDIFTYDMKLVYGCEANVMTERVKRFYWSIFHDETEPVPGVVSAVSHLRKNYRLDVITSRAEVLRSNTQRWLNRFIPDSFQNLHFTNGFGASTGDKIRSKSEVCTEIGAAVLIDDALKHAEEVANTNVPVLLPDRPWNQGPTPDGVTRVTSWGNVVTWIEKHVQ